MKIQFSEDGRATAGKEKEGAKTSYHAVSTMFTAQQGFKLISDRLSSHEFRIAVAKEGSPPRREKGKKIHRGIRTPEQITSNSNHRRRRRHQMLTQSSGPGKSLAERTDKVQKRCLFISLYS